ncbi:MAG: Fic family protein [Oscillospiraceae bacterium]|jgi:Fic family protein|nr:Fic family protein [Oscillospiraceae bacterium]
MSKYTEVVGLWRGWSVRSVTDIDYRLRDFKILFAYHSSRIENPSIAYQNARGIFENGRVLNFTGDPRSMFELENQKLCYEFLKHKIAVREPLTIALVLETHAILTGGTYDETRYIERGERPGAFKKHDYVTGREEVGSLPEDVPGDIEELLGEIRDVPDSGTLKAAAYFHARFEYIHPFADGNGRVGRTLLDYFLMTHDHPPVIIYDEDKAGYYAALESYDESEDIEPLHGFLVKQTERTWEKSMERVERSGTDSEFPSVHDAILADKEARRNQPQPPAPGKGKEIL